MSERDPIAHYPMPPTAFVDQVARDKAQEAMSEIEGHEKVCAERYQNIHDKLEGVTKDVNQKFSSLMKLLGWGGATAASIVIAIIAFLAVRLLDASDSDRMRLQAKVELLEAQQRAPAGQGR